MLHDRVNCHFKEGEEQIPHKISSFGDLAEFEALAKVNIIKMYIRNLSMKNAHTIIL